MATDFDKIIVTNRSALRAKYGSGFSIIEKSIQALIAADAKKNLKTKLVCLDDASLKTYGAEPVRQSDNGRQNKDAVDAVFRYFTPDYLLILGSRDVVPHIRLTNIANDDDGLIIDSDLPYASDHSYSKNGKDFLAPTRVVGRLPDVTGGKDARYLARLIQNAIAVKTLKRNDYADWFALTAKEWTSSSTTTVTNIFSSSANLLLSPKEEGPYNQLKNARVHFFNCHGGLRDHRFYGQNGKEYPVAFSSQFVAGRLKPGTFVAAECCYGAELYDPTQGMRTNISNTYLYNNAAAYVGSTTVAYGPSEGQGSADLITQYFVINVLKGYSTGRAFLEARQKFINVSGPRIDAVELKTIMQFLLLGDPSLHLVDQEKKTLVLEGGKAVTMNEGKIKYFRKVRRRQLQANGHRVGKATAAPKRKSKVPPQRHSQFAKLVRSFGFRDYSAETHHFDGKAKNEKHYCYVEKRRGGQAIHHPRILVFKETGDEIIVRLYERK